MDELQVRVAAGWAFGRTRITSVFPYEAYRARLAPEAEPVAVMKPDRRLLLFSTTQRPVVEPGDTMLTFAPPEPV